MNRVHYTIGGVLGLAGLMGACSNDDPMGMSELVTVTAMSPAAGATNVDVGTTVTLIFSRPMAAGMEVFVQMRHGDLTGQIVPGTWMWSQNRTRLEFHATTPLQHGTRYSVHMGGAVRDEAGNQLNYEHCITMHNAEWAWEHMMGEHQFGAGWKHQNGSYGVHFWFETS